MVDRIRLKWANEAGHGSQAEYVLASDYDALAARLAEADRQIAQARAMLLDAYNDLGGIWPALEEWLDATVSAGDVTP
jgi:hypothetical protein